MYTDDRDNNDRDNNDMDNNDMDNNDMYTDDSLEQPSALRYVPTTATPTAAKSRGPFVSTHITHHDDGTAIIEHLTEDEILAEDEGLTTASVDYVDAAIKANQAVLIDKLIEVFEEAGFGKMARLILLPKL